MKHLTKHKKLYATALLILGIAAFVIGMLFGNSSSALAYAAQEFTESGILQETSSENSEEEVPKEDTATAYSNHTLQDSTLVTYQGNLDYNCYAYAIGRTESPREFIGDNEQYIPGFISNNTVNHNNSVTDLVKSVQNDLSFLGYENISYSTTRPSVGADTYLICCRMGSGGQFHFMRYDYHSNAWYHKPGYNAILKYNYELSNERNWTNEYVDKNGVAHKEDTTYSGTIYYITYQSKPLAQYFGGGNGVKNNPFLIQNETQFRNISRAYSSVYVPGQGSENQINYAFKLTNNLSLGSWLPFDYKFTGQFNGNGHSVTYEMGITQQIVNSRSYFGLFGFVSGGATIINLELKDCKLQSSGGSLMSNGVSPGVGILAGSVYQASEITNVKVTNPTVNCDIASASVGGLVGTLSATAVKNCTVEGGSITSYSSCVGGMAGVGDYWCFYGGKCATTVNKENYEEGDKAGPVVGTIAEDSNTKIDVDYSGTKVNRNGSCIAAGTLITLANGKAVPVETLTGNEMLLVWNLYTGEFDEAPILFIDAEVARNHEVIRLTFSDGTIVKAVSEHGFWDYNLNEYIYLDRNAAQYLGHWFSRQTTNENGDFISERVQLTDVTVTRENTAVYSPVTYSHLCYYVNGMLSVPGGIDGLFNIFEVDPDGMRYDEAAMQADIEQYGLYTYEEFAQLVPVNEEMFQAFNGQYLKIAVEKGLTDISSLNRLAARYARYFTE